MTRDSVPPQQERPRRPSRQPMTPPERVLCRTALHCTAQQRLHSGDCTAATAATVAAGVQRSTEGRDPSYLQRINGSQPPVECVQTHSGKQLLRSALQPLYSRFEAALQPLCSCFTTALQLLCSAHSARSWFAVLYSVSEAMAGRMPSAISPLWNA